MQAAAKASIDADYWLPAAVRGLSAEVTKFQAATPSYPRTPVQLDSSLSASSSISLLPTFHLSLTSTQFQTKSSAMVLRQERNPLTPEFDALVEKLREEWHIPGLSISIVHGSSTYAKVLPPSKIAIDYLTILTIIPGLRLCFLSIHTHDHHVPLHNLQHYQSLHRRRNVPGD